MPHYSHMINPLLLGPVSCARAARPEIRAGYVGCCIGSGNIREVTPDLFHLLRVGREALWDVLAAPVSGRPVLGGVSVLWSTVVVSLPGVVLSPGLLAGQARADARFPHCFGTGAGPSGWKADTNGVMFH